MTIFNWDWLFELLNNKNENEKQDPKPEPIINEPLIIEQKEPEKTTKQELKLTDAQKLLLNYLTEPRTFKDMENYMKNHNYTMGATFEKLKKLGLIEKRDNLWYKTNS